MALTRSDVAKVALLARLRLEPHELDLFTGQLNSIVEFVNQLQEPDTTNVEPLAHGIEVRNVFREDVVGPSLSREDALANAPKRDVDCFLVPAVLE
ncbi:MAG: Asp-tRNA(Asn)/Glu-tRNA(Gln) amidotransferase subunit GatC [Isosphaeraceae bacterium]